MMRRLLLLLAILAASLAQSQVYVPGIAPVTGTLNVAGASCASLVMDSTNSGPSNCVSEALPSSASYASIVLSGTFTATVQFEISADNGSTWVSASPASSTTAGTTTFFVSGYTGVRARASAYTSGSVAVTISIGTGSAGQVGYPTGTDTGAVNAYVVANLVPPMRALVNGATGCFVPANANTNGTPTVNFNGLGAVTIAKQWGSLAATNELVTNKLACMVYDATAANFKLLNPAAVTGTGTGVMATSPTFITKISAPLVQISGTTFTTNAGCGEGALVGGVSAGKITTAGQTSCTDIITIATAATNGWQCTFTDLTTAADAASPHQTATTTTTVTWVSGTIVAADVIQFACTAY